MILSRGSTGQAVVELQSDLHRWGYEVGEIDGIFGRATEGAVLQFQMAEGLAVDGIAGPKTLGALEDGPHGEPGDDSDYAVELVDVPALQAATVAFALSDLGQAEVNGTNTGPEIAHLVEGYRDYWQIPDPPNGIEPAWCAMAVCVWTARALALGARGDEIDWSKHPFGRWRGSVISDNPLWMPIKDWAEEHDALLPADGPAPPGSIFIMYREGSGSDISKGSAAGHTGIVIEDQGDRVVTVDGNVSNRVKRMVREKSTLVGYVEWWKE